MILLHGVSTEMSTNTAPEQPDSREYLQMEEHQETEYMKPVKPAEVAVSTSPVYDTIDMTQKAKKDKKEKSPKTLTLALAGTLIAVVGLVVGFLIGYFAIPSQGECNT